jgi:hypothetical protein
MGLDGSGIEAPLTFLAHSASTCTKVLVLSSVFTWSSFSSDASLMPRALPCCSDNSNDAAHAYTQSARASSHDMYCVECANSLVLRELAGAV